MNLYSRNNVPKIKDRAYIVNLDEYESKRTRWIALQVKSDTLRYFDRFGVEHILKEIKKIIGNRNIKTNIYRIQAYDSIMCRYVCTGFIDFILKGKSLLENTNLFFHDE